MSGLGVIADYNSACPRYSVISIGAKKIDIDPIYSKLGAFHEEAYAILLGTRLKAREMPIKFEIEPGVQYSGRCDFITTDGEVHETKASLSKAFLYSVIRKGKVKMSHLAQLVSYMIQLKLQKGKIITGFYKQDGESFLLKESRDFEVLVTDTGDILVDGERIGYSVIDQYLHTKLIAEVLISKEIKERPLNDSKFSGPCAFCPLKNLCDKYDRGIVNSPDLIVQGLELLNNEKPKPYKS